MSIRQLLFCAMLSMLSTGLEATNASPASARLDASIRAGTGGDTAAFARCNLSAILDFYDGHQTPELIPDALLFSHVALVVKPERPPLSPAGRIELDKAIGALVEFAEDFERESRSLAKRVAAAPDAVEAERLRRQSHELSTRTQSEAEARAGRGLAALRQRLPREDRSKFERWLRDCRRISVIATIDYTRVTDWECRTR
jgi:hypothetical protein